MSNYKILLFDADETLFDFTKGERNAFRKVLEKRGLKDNQQWYERYHTMNQGLWKQFEQGEISREDIQRSRFTNFFQEKQLAFDGIEANQDFLNGLAESTELIAGAQELCQQLSKTYSLYIITNGIGGVQHNRFEKSELHPYFKDIFVSEDIGFQKPQREYFDFVLQTISVRQKAPVANEQVLVIGDSLSSDIQGAINMGLDCCWYHPDTDENPNQLHYTYEITALEELLEIL